MTARAFLTRVVLAGLLAMGASTGIRAQDADHPKDKKLTVGLDIGYAPWAMRAPDGSVEGFQVDMLNDIARRIGRPGVEFVDANFSAIFAGLFAKRYEMIGSPIAITKERAEQMAFTESWRTGGNAFTTLLGEPDITAPEMLKGKIVATNSGSVADAWLTANAEKYGFTVQKYDKDTDAQQAVLIGRAYASLADLARSEYAAGLNKKTKVSPYIVAGAGAEVGIVVRKDDRAFLEQVEGAIECMKKDGTFKKINMKWFKNEGDPNSSMNKVYPGIGPVGMPGYDPAPNFAPKCS